MKKRRKLTPSLDSDFMSSMFDDTLRDLGIAVEAPIDVTGDTAAGTTAALGPDARTSNRNTGDEDIKTDADTPAELLSEENTNDATGGEEGGEDETAEGEGDAGEGDPEAEDGGDGTGDELGDDNTPTDDSDDPEGIKKKRLMDNMCTLHDMIQKNSALLSKCNVSTISAAAGKANSKIINILNSMADIIYKLLTDGTWEKTPYPQLMQKYVGLNMVFDLTVKMLEENVLSAEKERDRSIATAKRQAARLKNMGKLKPARTVPNSFTGQRP